MSAPAAPPARGRPGGSGVAAPTRRFYRRVLAELNAAGVEFLVGGGHALERYLGIGRSVKDLDLFMRERDVPAALRHVEARLGHRTEVTFPHWLAKIIRDEENHIDVIFNSGNAVCPVDDDWFRHAVPSTVMGEAVRLCPAEETIWSKAFVMERERYDGADIAHLLHARAETLDWPRLVRRFGPHWRVLLSHLVLFGFIYPSERRRIPEALLRRGLHLLQEEMRHAPTRRICRGTLTSRAQYLVDVQLWGYEDARLLPHGAMTEGEASIWTAAIDEAASRPIGTDALGDAAGEARG
jgi:predicted nucleotidyltransferase